MSSIYTGVSGMQANQQAVDVIANNVANMNTIAFKASRVTFEDVLVQTLYGGTAGVNPMQIGYGAATGTVDTIMTQGNLRQTGRTLDMAIMGDGFFVVNDGNRNHYTRDGVFQLDATNTLVMGSNGMRVMGWTANPDTEVMNVNAQPGAINLPLGAQYAKATSKVTFGGNLNAEAVSGDTATSTFHVYDSLGSEHTVTVDFVRADDGSWTWTANCPDAATGTTPGTGTLTFDQHGRVTGTGLAAISLSLENANGAADPVEFDIDFNSMSQLAGESTTEAKSQDGLPKGVLQNFSVDSDGKIYGSFTNGANRLIGQLAMATFTNPAGMSREGANLWNISPNSGSPSVHAPSASDGNMVRSGYVETSNVDLSTEFANLIVAQRGFQANSRTITSSDEMMQEILQLKR